MRKLALSVLSVCLATSVASAQQRNVSPPDERNWVFVHDYAVVDGSPVSLSAVVMDAAGTFITSGTSIDVGTWHGWSASIDRVLVTPTGEIRIAIEFSAKPGIDNYDPVSCTRHHVGHWSIHGGTGAFDGMTGHGLFTSLVQFDCTTGEEFAIHEVNEGTIKLRH